MHKTFATSAKNKRVSLLNLNRKTKISVVTRPSNIEENSGTKVTIRIPLKNDK